MRSTYQRMPADRSVVNSSDMPQSCVGCGWRSGSRLPRTSQEKSEFEQPVGPAGTTSRPSRVRHTLAVFTEDRPLKWERDEAWFFPDHLYVAHDNLLRSEGDSMVAPSAAITLRGVPHNPQVRLPSASVCPDCGWSPLTRSATGPGLRQIGCRRSPRRGNALCEYRALHVP